LGRRRPDDIAIDYPDLNARSSRGSPGSPAKPALAARGITTEGKPAHRPGPRPAESADAWHRFPGDLTEEVDGGAVAGWREPEGGLRAGAGAGACRRRGRLRIC
jgi:hypothetical protein